MFYCLQHNKQNGGLAKFDDTRYKLRAVVNCSSGNGA